MINPPNILLSTHFSWIKILSETGQIKHNENAN